MVRGAVGGRCDHAAGDRNADPLAIEDGVEKLPIDWRVEAAARNASRKDHPRKPLRSGRVQTTIPSGSPCITIPSATSASTLTVKTIE